MTATTVRARRFGPANIGLKSTFTFLFSPGPDPGLRPRRSELAALDCGHIQQRDGRWVFVDLVGKGKRIRTAPIPPFVKVAIDAWTAAAGLSEGPLFRRVRRRKYSEKTPAALSQRMIWQVVTKYARQTGLVDKLAPMI